MFLTNVEGGWINFYLKILLSIKKIIFDLLFDFASQNNFEIMYDNLLDYFPIFFSIMSNFAPSQTHEQ